MTQLRTLWYSLTRELTSQFYIVPVPMAFTAGCHDDCEECDGVSSSDCTQCIPGKVLVAGTCIGEKNL